MIRNPLDDNGLLSFSVVTVPVDKVEQTASSQSVSLGVAGDIVDKGTDRSSATVTAVEEEDDPDLIVLGFQELDLSTGALLYYTETTREDAWYSAVLAGLGEKAVEYDKVSQPKCAVVVVGLYRMSGL